MEGTEPVKGDPYVEVFEDDGGEWRYRLRASNNEILVTSEGYDGGEAHARRALETMVEAVDTLILRALSKAENHSKYVAANAKIGNA